MIELIEIVRLRGLKACKRLNRPHAAADARRPCWRSTLSSPFGSAYPMTWYFLNRVLTAWAWICLGFLGLRAHTTARISTSSKLRTGGAGGYRTHDPGIMSPLL